MRHLFLKASFSVVCIALGLVFCTGKMISAAPSSDSEIRVAAVQFDPQETVAENTAVIVKYLEQCAKDSVRVVVFQECATTGYTNEAIERATEKELQDAEKRIAQACREYDVYAVVGTPHHDDGVLYNTAVVLDPDGKIVDRYAKMQLVGGDRWAKPGETLVVFPIDGIPCSIIICHDERYPELVRLPVLVGARLVFYISSESDITVERKLEPYRAQITARADENDIYIVHANSPAMLSHGQSRIVGPDGNLIAEAEFFGNRVVTATLDMRRANGGTALNSLRANSLREWWEEGIRKVRVKK